MKNNIQGAILETIEQMVIKCINDAPFDRTVKARVVEVLGDNTYKVSFEGGTYEITTGNDTSYSANTVVRVMIPQNDFSEMFILK